MTTTCDAFKAYDAELDKHMEELEKLLVDLVAVINAKEAAEAPASI